MPERQPFGFMQPAVNFMTAPFSYIPGLGMPNNQFQPPPPLRPMDILPFPYPMDQPYANFFESEEQMPFGGIFNPDLIYNDYFNNWGNFEEPHYEEAELEYEESEPNYYDYNNEYNPWYNTFDELPWDPQLPQISPPYVGGADIDDSVLIVGSGEDLQPAGDIIIAEPVPHVAEDDLEELVAILPFLPPGETIQDNVHLGHPDDVAAEEVDDVLEDLPIA